MYTRKSENTVKEYVREHTVEEERTPAADNQPDEEEHDEEQHKSAELQQTTTVNINTASKDELMTLKGIGETKAAAVVSFRAANGSFACIEDIMKVPGIKEGTFAKIKDRIRVN